MGKDLYVIEQVWKNRCDFVINASEQQMKDLIGVLSGLLAIIYRAENRGMGRKIPKLVLEDLNNIQMDALIKQLREIYDELEDKIKDLSESIKRR